MACYWGSWASECDIPHWLGLIIEAGIGGVVAFFFYWIQKGKAKKREAYILRKLSDDIIFLEDQNEELGETVDAHYEQNAPQDDFFEQLEFMRSFCGETRSDISLFAQDINEKLIDEIDKLLSAIERPLPFMQDQWRDEGFVDYNADEIKEIKKIIDVYNPKYIKEAQKRREDSMMDLAIANILFRQRFLGENASDPSLPQLHIDNRGSFWWE